MVNEESVLFLLFLLRYDQEYEETTSNLICLCVCKSYLCLYGKKD